MTVAAFFWVVPGLYLLFALAFALVGWHPAGTRGARWASGGFVAAAVGSIFDTQRALLPQFVFLASPLHWAAVFCLLKSFLVRRNVDLARLPLFILVALGMAAHGTFMFLWPSDAGRIVALNVLVPLMIATGLPALYRSRKSAIDTMIFGLLSAAALTYPIRLMLFFGARQYTDLDYQFSNWPQYSIVFYLVAASIGVLTALALMLATGADLIHAQMRVSTVDPLTGISNRRAVEQWIEQERETGAIYGAALMIDLDHFKRINDGYGHAVGDIVLKAVARELSAKLDGFADVARIGGEEFVALVRQEHAEAAGALALTTRSAIAAIRFEGELSALKFTTSVGYAAREPGIEVEALIRRADMAVYQAKAAGRNQTMKAVVQSGLVVLSKVA